MNSGYYGREPFDLRLTALRLFRRLGLIVLVTLTGTLVFGGGYYVKKVLMNPEPDYSVTSTYRVEYDVAEEKDVSTVHINEMTWNTYVDTQLFQMYVRAYLPENLQQISDSELAAALDAELLSNLKVLTTVVITEEPNKSLDIAAAVEKAMVQDFPKEISEITSVSVIDNGVEAREVYPDVRPLRAVILSAVLSCFFCVIFFLLKELGDDSIWLPSSIRHRYGLKVLGTIESPELSENLAYLFQEKKRVAVCAMEEQTDPMQVIDRLRDVCKEYEPLQQEGGWFPVPAPLLAPEGCRALRQAEGILLAVPAGSHVGKRLEYVLEFLEQQECKITAVILWDADELLLRTYYHAAKLIKGKAWRAV